MTSMPLTFRTMLDVLMTNDRSRDKRRTRRLSLETDDADVAPSVPPHQDWQSAAVLRASFLSARYFSAPALTIGLMICSSACMKSELKAHLLPSQVCTR